MYSLTVAIGVLLFVCGEARASSEYIRAETDDVKTVIQLYDAADLEAAADPTVTKNISLPRGLRNTLFRNATWQTNFRTYYFDEYRENDRDRRALATGGEFHLEATTRLEWFSLGASLYTSQPVHAPEKRDGTGLLASGQESITTLGRGYLQFDVNKTRVRLFRQSLYLPYINRQDSRMIPNTFNAAIMAHNGNRLEAVVGYINSIKPRTSDDFISMSEQAGATGRHSGASIAGLRWNFGDDASIGAINTHVIDVYNQLYAESAGTFDLSESVNGKWGLQFTDQRSVGDELIGSFDTWALGAHAAFGYKSLVLEIAHTRVGDGAGIRSPFGGRPGFTSLMMEKFERANEKAMRIGLSMSLKRFGLDAVSTNVQLARGVGAEDPATGASVANQTEFNWTIDYRPRTGRLRGVWLRVRWATEEADRNRRQLRLIANYTVPRG